jgi:hypothetical protein
MRRVVKSSKLEGSDLDGRDDILDDNRDDSCTLSYADNTSSGLRNRLLTALACFWQCGGSGVRVPLAAHP